MEMFFPCQNSLDFETFLDANTREFFIKSIFSEIWGHQ